MTAGYRVGFLRRILDSSRDELVAIMPVYPSLRALAASMAPFPAPEDAAAALSLFSDSVSARGTSMVDGLASLVNCDRLFVCL